MPCTASTFGDRVHFWCALFLPRVDSRHQRAPPHTAAWQLPQPARRMHLDPAAPLKDHSKPCYRDVDKTQVTRYCGFYARTPHTARTADSQTSRDHTHTPQRVGVCCRYSHAPACYSHVLSLALHRRQGDEHAPRRAAPRGGMVKVQSPGQCPSSAPAPSQARPDGSGQLGTPGRGRATRLPASASKAAADSIG